MLYNRGYGSVEYRSVEDVLTIEFTKESPIVAKPVTVTRALPVPSIDGATPVDVVLTLPPMKNNKSEFQVNGVPFWKAKPYRREARREAALDREERLRLGSPVPPARLLLPGDRRRRVSRCGRWR